MWQNLCGGVLTAVRTCSIPAGYTALMWQHGRLSCWAVLFDRERGIPCLCGVIHIWWGGSDFISLCHVGGAQTGCTNLVVFVGVVLQWIRLVGVFPFCRGCQRAGGLHCQAHCACTHLLDLLMHGKCYGAASAPGMFSYAPFSNTSLPRAWPLMQFRRNRYVQPRLWCCALFALMLCKGFSCIKYCHQSSLLRIAS